MGFVTVDSRVTTSPDPGQLSLLLGHFSYGAAHGICYIKNAKNMSALNGSGDFLRWEKQTQRVETNNVRFLLHPSAGALSVNHNHKMY